MVDIIYRENSRAPRQVSYNGKIYKYNWVDVDEICIYCDIEEVDSLINNNVQEIIIMCIEGFDVEENKVVYSFEISHKGNNIFMRAICDIPSKDWESKWSPKKLIDSIKNNEFTLNNINIKNIDTSIQPYSVEFEKIVDKKENIRGLIYDFSSEINRYIKQCEIDLDGFRWKSKYEEDEELFCKEVIRPILRKMGFLDVRYTCGSKEYGRDFTFSELTKFGDFRYYGLQAKAGSISGGIKSKIDEIIGQIEDAFAMPYFELGIKSPRYISTLIIAISGHFTENAREKIVQKIPNGVIGSVYFIDQEKIMGLVEQFWILR